MTEIADSATLVGRDVDGRTATWEVKAGQLVDLPGSALTTQRMRAADGAMLVRRSLRGGSDDPAFVLLDNEIRALARLSRAFPNERARPFPLLVGYDVDSRDPWALVSEYRGQPAREAASGLLSAGLMALVIRLFDALTRMHLVEVAHNRLDLECMYLTETSLQIVTFEHAALFGEPRADRPGPAMPQDDLLDAGRLLYEVFTSRPALTERPDLSEVPVLKSHLEDLFAEPRKRPATADVLRRFVEPGKVPVVESLDALRAGRIAFEQARGRKHGYDADRPPPPQAAAPPRRRRFWSTGGTLALLMSVAFIVTEGWS